MKFHLASAQGNIVTALGPGWVRVGADRYDESVVIAPDAIVAPWAEGGFDALTEEDFERVKALSPVIVLLGTGAKQRFPHPRLYRSLTDASIGVEVMHSAAAARTYNIIVAEGRRVAAALILESAA
ncbi:MAG TPA: Mth938-like domain-containing protein [Casimicrobiaceae bacterium]|nr:Mth938-like domain-containing protein [Casimicrobiaceae bacterium]